MSEEKPKIWWEGEKTYTIIFTDEDITVVLKYLAMAKGRNLSPETESEKEADRVLSRIYFQMSCSK